MCATSACVVDEVTVAEGVQADVTPGPSPH